MSAVLDLKKTRHAKAVREIHKLFCSTYIQLWWVKSLQGVQLLDKIDWYDVNHSPHPELQAETARLDQYSKNTLRAWRTKWTERRQIKNV